MLQQHRRQLLLLSLPGRVSFLLYCYMLKAWHHWKIKKRSNFCNKIVIHSYLLPPGFIESTQKDVESTQAGKCLDVVDRVGGVNPHLCGCEAKKDKEMNMKWLDLPVGLLTVDSFLTMTTNYSSRGQRAFLWRYFSTLMSLLHTLRWEDVSVKKGAPSNPPFFADCRIMTCCLAARSVLLFLCWCGVTGQVVWSVLHCYWCCLWWLLLPPAAGPD